MHCKSIRQPVHHLTNSFHIHHIMERHMMTQRLSDAYPKQGLTTLIDYTDNIYYFIVLWEVAHITHRFCDRKQLFCLIFAMNNSYPCTSKALLTGFLKIHLNPLNLCGRKLFLSHFIDLEHNTRQEEHGKTRYGFSPTNKLVLLKLDIGLIND